MAEFTGAYTSHCSDTGTFLTAVGVADTDYLTHFMLGRVASGQAEPEGAAIPLRPDGPQCDAFLGIYWVHNWRSQEVIRLNEHGYWQGYSANPQPIQYFKDPIWGHPIVGTTAASDLVTGKRVYALNATEVTTVQADIGTVVPATDIYDVGELVKPAEAPLAALRNAPFWFVDHSKALGRVGGVIQ